MVIYVCSLLKKYFGGFYSFVLRIYVVPLQETCSELLPAKTKELLLKF